MRFFAGYQLLEEIGRGALATVFRARAPGGDEVAVKVLDAEPHREAAVRFEREQRILAALGEGRGLLPLITFGGPPHAERPFIVMPYAAGGSLRDRLRGGPLAVRDTIALGVSLAKALHVAHERGVVHRDVKPENVLFTRRGRTAVEWGEPLLVDFGLAKMFGDGRDASPSFTTTGDIVGTMS
ncbi:MAG: serine/threonine-protein kinase [Planctomycetota bacterium]